MHFLDNLYGSDAALWSDADALCLLRYRIGALLREIYWGPLFSAERSSLSAAIDSHAYRLESPGGFSRLLAKCFPDVHSELRWDRDPPSGTLTRDEALRIVVLGFDAMRKRLPEIRRNWNRDERRPMSGAEWLRNRKDSDGFWAIDPMIAAIQPHLGKWFSGFLIHGSVASGEAVSGYSDLDTLIVLSNEALGSETELDRVLRFLSSTHVFLLQFNPYMHHSHMLAAEMEFEAMSLAATPPCLFYHGAYWGHWPERTGIARSDIDSLLAFRTFDWFFEDWVRVRQTLRDAYEVIWWTSNAVMMPVLYVQLRDGIDRWKPDALDAARPDLNRGQLEFLDFLTELRTKLCRVPVLSRDWWRGFPPDAHPALAVEWARRMTSEIDWTAYGLTPARLAQSSAFFRDIRQLALRSWRKQNSPKPPVKSIWLDLPSPVLFNEEPRPADISEYDHVRKEFLAKAREVEGTVGVFEFGQVGCPGLSDLDFLLVLDDQPRPEADLAARLSLSGRSAEIMGHKPMVIGVDALRLLPAVFPVFRLERLWGKVECPQTTPFSDSSILPLMLSMLLTKYPADLISLAGAPSLQLGTLAAFVHSFVHLKNMLSCVDDGHVESVEEVVALDMQIRSEWGSMQRLDWREMITGLDLMFSATADLLAWVDSFLRRLAMSSPDSAGTGEWKPSDGWPIQFISGWSGPAMISSLEQARNGLTQPILFPASIGEYLAWIAAGEGPASEKLRKQTRFASGQPNNLVFGRFSHYRECLNLFVSAEKAAGRSMQKYIALTEWKESGSQSDGQKSTRLNHLRSIRNALAGYHHIHGTYPKSSGGWDGLYTKWGDSKPDWVPGIVPEYLSELPRDPRNTDLPEQQYLYRSDGRNFKLISHTPDDISAIRQTHPELIDPMRAGWAYGFWTDGAVGW